MSPQPSTTISRGHNLPWPKAIRLEPDVAYRIPGSRRCFQLVTPEPVPYWLLASLDGEHWEPLRVRRSAGEGITTHEPWTWVKWRVEGDEARLWCTWEPWPGFEGIEPWRQNI